jgi:hypothetical protein
VSLVELVPLDVLLLGEGPAVCALFEGTDGGTDWIWSAPIPSVFMVRPPLRPTWCRCLCLVRSGECYPASEVVEWA